MTEVPSGERVLRACYGALLRCYPAEFRFAFGLEMEEAFVDQLREAQRGGVLRTLIFLTVAIVDAVQNGVRERFSRHSAEPRMFQWMDVRYAFRLLRRSPVFTLLTVLVLSGGLGVSIFTFSFLNTALLKPLPVTNGNGVVRIMQHAGTSGGPFDVVDIREVRQNARTVRELGVYTSLSLVVDDPEHARVIDATIAQWNMFEFTHSRPILGRTFTFSDAAAGAEPVIVLGYRTWIAAFGGDEAIVGKPVVLNGVSTRVIGVMPSGYGFPVASAAWMPLSNESLETRVRGMTFVELYGRMVPGVSTGQVQTEVTTLFHRARANARLAVSADSAKVLAAIDAVTVAWVQTFAMAQMGEEGPRILTVLNVLAALVLLLACMNVTNLLLARSNERVRETAVRLALGASRGRLVMQSMWESILLCVAGGAVATAMAAWSLDAINTWASLHLEGNLAFWWVWGLDRSSVIAAALFVTATIGVLGIAVSARATSLQFLAVLNDGGARSGSRREGRVARVLVISQVATVSLLMFFGVMSGIVAHRIVNLDAGLDTRHLLSANFDIDDSRYNSPEKRNQLYAGVLHALNTSPAVNGALIRSNVANITDQRALIALDGQPIATNGANARAYEVAIGGPIMTLGLSVTDGREFDSSENATGTPVALVSRAFAEKYWPGTSPIGRSLRLASENSDVSRTVVGVVSNMTHGPPFSKARSAVTVYLPLTQYRARGTEIVFRHRGSAGAAQGALYRALWGADSRMQPPEVRSYDEILEKSALIAQSTANLFGACFAFALLIAVSGTYGLMARSIGQRTREIGVRRALGASDGAVIALLLGQGGRQLAIGVVVAIPLMFLVGVGFERKFPVGILTTVASGVAVATIIVSVVLLATYLPTRRAIAVELRDALWKE